MRLDCTGVVLSPQSLIAYEVQSAVCFANQIMNINNNKDSCDMDSFIEVSKRIHQIVSPIAIPNLRIFKQIFTFSTDKLRKSDLDQ